MTTKTATAKKKWLPKHKRWVHFTHRDTLRAKHAHPALVAPSTIPATTLPVDCTGNASVSCPMLGNDTLGICGPAMCAHIDEIRTFGQGQSGFGECTVDQAALQAQYEQVSGGDNGTDEDMLVGTSGIWCTGIAGDTTQTVADHLDFDITNAPLTQYLIDQFYAVCMAWAVPDLFLQEFQTGASFLDAMTPDPNNGHYTAQADVDASGNVRLWTWGGWCWVSAAFIASVDPQAFVTFSALQFNAANGLDSHGRHVSDQAALWVNLGGDSAKVSAIVGLFPPKAGS